LLFKLKSEKFAEFRCHIQYMHFTATLVINYNIISNCKELKKVFSMNDSII